MWKEVSEARYDEALGVLSPTIWLGKGFLMGEPHDYRPCTVTNKIGPTYAAFIQALGRYYEGDPMTILSRNFFREIQSPLHGRLLFCSKRYPSKHTPSLL
jgi:hypothetical protein